MLVIPLDLWSKEVKRTLIYGLRHSNRLSGPDAQKHLKPKKIRSCGLKWMWLESIHYREESLNSKGCNKSPEVKSVLCVLHFLPEPDSWAEGKLSQAVKSDSTPVKVDHKAILHPQTSQAHIILRFCRNNTHTCGAKVWSGGVWRHKWAFSDLWLVVWGPCMASDH